MILRIFLFVAFMQIISNIKAQTINIPLQRCVGLGHFVGALSPTIRDSITEIKNIPPKIHDYIIKYTDISFNCLDKNITNDSGKLRIHFLIGLKSDSILIIVDANYNLDFSDDVRMVYPIKKNDLTELPYINILFPKCNSTLTIQPYPYHSAFKYYSSIENEFYLMLKTFEHFYGHLPSSDFSIALITNNLSPIVEDQKMIDIALINNNNGKRQYYKLGDIFNIDNRQYTFNNINKTGDTLSIKAIDTSLINYGFSEGLTIKPVTFETIAKRKINIPSKNGYILLDFWGTWCKPCLEILPDIKILSQKHKNYLDIISIAAYDQEDKVIEYVTKEKITWQQVIEDSRTNKPLSIIKSFRVHTFPTLILINEKGKIIIRGNTKKTLHQIDSFLESIKE